MQSIKEELLKALAECLEKIHPGAGQMADFENPRNSAHGDLTITVCMKLAKQINNKGE